MTSQSPIKVNGPTKERIRYLAAVIDTTQSDIVDRAVQEFAVRHADMIEKGLAHARSVLGAADAAVAAHVLDLPVEAVQGVAGTSR